MGDVYLKKIDKIDYRSVRAIVKFVCSTLSNVVSPDIPSLDIVESTN